MLTFAAACASSWNTVLQAASNSSHPARPKAVQISVLSESQSPADMASCRVLLPVLLACCLLQSTFAFEHGQVGSMTTDCQHRLGQIFDDYYESPLLEGAYNCSELLQGAIANQDGEDCPDDNSMVGCFSVRLTPQS